MTYIEGIGDEVIECLIVLVIIVFATLAWWSTSTSDRPLMRTVYIVALHGRSGSDAGQPVALTEVQNDTGQSDASLLVPHSSSIKTDTESVTPVEEVNLTNESPDGEEASQSSTSTTSPPLEVGPATLEVTAAANEGAQTDRENSADDSPSSVLRQRRIAFFQNRGPTLLEQVDGVENNGSNNQTASEPRETISEVKFAGAQSVNSAEPSSSTMASNSNSGQTNSDDSIKIKLMYLNEDQKLVDGRRQELLGDFKRRHFNTELSANKVVKLIFNGRLLLKDAETLQSCGLYNNCVVHCLIHANRNNQQSGGNNSSSNGSSPPNQSSRYTNQPNGQPVSEWRLGTLLYSCLLIILSFCWYCQFSYSQLFTFTTTAALTVLTILFLISLLPNNIPYLEYLHNNEVHVIHQATNN